MLQTSAFFVIPNLHLWAKFLLRKAYHLHHVGPNAKILLHHSHPIPLLLKFPIHIQHFHSPSAYVASATIPMYREVSTTSSPNTERRGMPPRALGHRHLTHLYIPQQNGAPTCIPFLSFFPSPSCMVNTRLHLQIFITSQVRPVRLLLILVVVLNAVHWQSLITKTFILSGKPTMTIQEQPWIRLGSLPSNASSHSLSVLKHISFNMIHQIINVLLIWDHLRWTVGDRLAP